MKALVWHGMEDIRCDTVFDPVEHTRNATIKVTNRAICGSDLHLSHNLSLTILQGEIMEHEAVCERTNLKGDVAAGIDGNMLDLGTLATALHLDKPRRPNAVVASAMVGSVTLLDLAAYAGVRSAHRVKTGHVYDYSVRRGFPREAEGSRDLACKDYRTPLGYRAKGTFAAAYPALAF